MNFHFCQILQKQYRKVDILKKCENAITPKCHALLKNCTMRKRDDRAKMVL